MGIININTDSFSGDGDLDPSNALEKARAMVAGGADVIDVGGESARTNRAAISEQEEIDRVAPFIEAFLREAPDWKRRDSEQVQPPMLSVNTWRNRVARSLLGVGGDLLNDMSGLPEATNAETAARHGAALLIMHSKGEPKVAHRHVLYADVMQTMEEFFASRIDLALSAGLSRDQILLDPGIEFAKQLGDNLRVMNGMGRLHAFGRPVLLPVSRKSMIGEVLGIADPAARDAGTVACIAHGVRGGAHIFRVHNVDAAFSSIKVLQALVCGGVGLESALSGGAA